MYCIWSNHGEMKKRELIDECQQEKMLPILVMRTPNEGPIVPVFRNTKTAKTFIKRNLPKNWVCGLVNLTMHEAQLMDEKGWKAICYSFPRVLKDVLQFDIEIFECDSVKFQNRGNHYGS